METLPCAVPGHILLSQRPGWARGSRLQVTTLGRRESSRRLNKYCPSSGHISEEMPRPAALASLLGGEFRDMLAKGTTSREPQRSLGRPLARSGTQAVQAAWAPQGRGLGWTEAGRTQQFSFSLALAEAVAAAVFRFSEDATPGLAQSSLLRTETPRGGEPHPGRGGRGLVFKVRGWPLHFMVSPVRAGSDSLVSLSHCPSPGSGAS